MSSSARQKCADFSGAEFHRIATYLSRYTSEPIGIILSIGLLNELFKKKWSENLPEAF